MLRERVGKFERACDHIALDDIQLRGPSSLQLLAVCEDRGVARACRLGMRRVSVCRALVLLRRIAEIMVLEQEVRQPVVDRRRIGVLRERIEIVAVPSPRLVIIRELLARFLRALILRVIMRGEILQVRLQVGEHLWRLFGFEVSPVFALQSVLGRELAL